MKFDYNPLSPSSSIRVQREKLDMEIDALNEKIKEGNNKIKELKQMIEEYTIQVVDKTQQSRNLKEKEANQLLLDIENKKSLLKELKPTRDNQEKSPRKQITKTWDRAAMEAAVADLTGCSPHDLVIDIGPSVPPMKTSFMKASPGRIDLNKFSPRLNSPVERRPFSENFHGETDLDDDLHSMPSNETEPIGTFQFAEINSLEEEAENQVGNTYDFGRFFSSLVCSPSPKHIGSPSFTCSPTAKSIRPNQHMNGFME